MKLSKKFVSVLCAVAMLVSALPAASAVSAEPLSEYAGKTLPVQVVEETESGMTSRIIEVAIPEGATYAEERALVYSAAFGPVPYSANQEVYFLSEEENITLTTAEQRVGGGARPSGVTYFNQVIVYAYVSSAETTNANLKFQVRDTYNPDMATVWKDVSLMPNMQVIINCGGLPSTQRGISVYAKTTIGYVVLSRCSVQGIVN